LFLGSRPLHRIIPFGNNHQRKGEPNYVFIDDYINYIYGRIIQPSGSIIVFFGQKQYSNNIVTNRPNNQPTNLL